ncbi:MAG TPA: 2'-5' RNA ligase family protein [Fulvivirga sp.]|nr:2'-5' RNA ligase family protein [Fulvivirga sp.]
MSTDKNLYFLAIIPPEPIKSETQEVKQIFADQYDSKGALKSPPHVTLHMPFKLKVEKENDIIKKLKLLAVHQQSFEMVLNGFGHFKQRVIYLDVEQNESLFNLFLEIRKFMKVNYNIFNADYKNRGFHPHLTVAFRDLSKEKFKEAWPLFEDRSFRRPFTAYAIALLKHNGTNWDVACELPFS